jgi:hypothetical protein
MPYLPCTSGRTEDADAGDSAACRQIRRANAENQALIAVATDNSELFLSLRAQLGLTDEQCQQIASLAVPASEEARKLDAIRKCFSALRAHDWLYVPGIEVCDPAAGCLLGLRGQH